MSRTALERIKESDEIYNLMPLVLFGNRVEEENGSQEGSSPSIGGFLQLPRLLCSGDVGGLISRALIRCLLVLLGKPS